MVKGWYLNFTTLISMVPPLLLVIIIYFTRNTQRVVKGGKRVVTAHSKGGKGVLYTPTLCHILTIP